MYDLRNSNRYKPEFDVRTKVMVEIALDTREACSDIKAQADSLLR